MSFSETGQALDHSGQKQLRSETKTEDEKEADLLGKGYWGLRSQLILGDLVVQHQKCLLSCLGLSRWLQEADRQQINDWN